MAWRNCRTKTAPVIAAYRASTTLLPTAKDPAKPKMLAPVDRSQNPIQPMHVQHVGAIIL